MTEYINSREYVLIGSGDYGYTYLKRINDRIQLKKYVILDYEYMEDYIRDNHDTLSDWQNDAYNWRTEESYNEWLGNYEYPYEDYFDYDSDTWDYYDSNADDTTRDFFDYDLGIENDRERVVDRVIEVFYDAYYDNWFHYNDLNENSFRELIGNFYDSCLKRKTQEEERQKPHWQAFSYYK